MQLDKTNLRDRKRKILVASLLSLVCLMAGYGFYKMDPQEPLVAIIFTIGILGLILSVVRGSVPKN